LAYSVCSAEVQLGTAKLWYTLYRMTKLDILTALRAEAAVYIDVVVQQFRLIA